MRILTNKLPTHDSGKSEAWLGVKVGNNAFLYNFCRHKKELKIWIPKMALIAIKMSSRVTDTIWD